LDIQKEIRKQIEENIAVKQQLLKQLPGVIEQAATRLVQCLKNGGKIMLCGNGGSAADAQHIAAELVVRLKSSFNRPAIPALALTVDTSILTAGGNDFGFDHIFARQVEALGKSGDALIAISTSGNSANVIEAVRVAREKGILTVGFLGGDGGKLKEQVDIPIVIPTATTARIQESHILIGHILCEIIEQELFAS